MIVGLLEIMGWGVMAESGRRGYRHIVSVFVDWLFQTFCGKTIFTNQGIQFHMPILLLATPKFHKLNFQGLLAIGENHDNYAPQKFGCIEQPILVSKC